VTIRRSPTIRRRRLGIELRRLRESADLTIEDVARRLGYSDSKVSRIETGQVTATPQDVRDMLGLYGITGEQQEALVQVAREAREKGWWQAYSDTLVVPLVGLEVAATTIRIYEVLVVPGVFQTEAYAQAVIRTMRPDLPPGQLSRWIELRMARGRSLFNRPDPPAVTAVVDEGVLRRPVGGRDVMRGQLRRLAQMAAHPAVTLHVLPFSAGEHAAMSGPFTLFGFSDPVDPDVVYLEHITSDLYLEDAGEVRRYVRAFDRLCGLALNPDDSVDLVERLAGRTPRPEPHRGSRATPRG
jgi:transcriptional regulator with XRE-family HTH domain